MNSDIRIQTTFKGNRKRKRLSNILQCEATGYLIDLWITVAEERDTGTLTGWDAEDIALAAGWEGDPQVFVDALVQSKLLDINGDGVYHTHDWVEHQPWISGTSSRRESGRKAGIASALKRWGDRKEKLTENNGTLQPVKEPCNGTVTAGQRNGNPVPVPYRTKTVPVPYQDIISLFHRLCPSLPQVRDLTDKRKRLIKSIYLKDSIKGFEELFTEVEKSDFLTGRQVSSNNPNWKCNFDWIIKGENKVKILEGVYENQGGNHGKYRGIPGNQPAGAFDDLEDMP